jgi:DNA-binding transcriptional MerR regulator
MSLATPTLPQFRIGTVARLTGLTVYQIRAWEKRYRTVEPTRSSGGDRLYSEDDVSRLSLLKQLNDLGHSIGSTAQLPHPQLERMLALHEEGQATALGAKRRASPRAGMVESSSNLADVAGPFLEAISNLDVLRAERVLAEAAGAMAPADFVSRVMLPVLQRVGTLWTDGQFNVAHEHAASAVLRTQLGGLMRTLFADENAPVAVCTTPATELHEFGALSAALYAASYGWRVVYLGPNLPAEEICQAAAIAGARLVLISVVCAGDLVADELRRLSQSLPGNVTLVIGGAGSADLKGMPARVRRAQVLADLAMFL